MASTITTTPTPQGHGFYKAVGDGYSVFYAPNSITGPGIALTAAAQSTYTYPVQGWSWFAGEDAARIALALPTVAQAWAAMAAAAALPPPTLP